MRSSVLLLFFVSDWDMGPKDCHVVWWPMICKGCNIIKGKLMTSTSDGENNMSLKSIFLAGNHSIVIARMTLYSIWRIYGIHVWSIVSTVALISLWSPYSTSWNKAAISASRSWAGSLLFPPLCVDWTLWALDKYPRYMRFQCRLGALKTSNWDMLSWCVAVQPWSHHHGSWKFHNTVRSSVFLCRWISMQAWFDASSLVLDL